MRPTQEAIDLTRYAAAVNGAVLAGLAVIGALAAFGVGNAQAVAGGSSSSDLGTAPALPTVRAYHPSTEARVPGATVHTRGGMR